MRRDAVCRADRPGHDTQGRMYVWARRLVLAVMGLGSGELGYRIQVSAGALRHEGRLAPEVITISLSFVILSVAVGVALGEVATKLQSAEKGVEGGALRALQLVAASVAMLGLAVSLPFDRGYAVTLTLCSLAFLAWASFERTRPGLIIGITLAALGTSVDLFGVGRGWYAFPEGLRHVWNIPAWRPAFYFSAGIVVSQATRAINGAFAIGK